MEKKSEYYNSLSVCLERMDDLNGARKSILFSSVLSPYGNSHIDQLIRICIRTGDTELGLISIMNRWNHKREMERCKSELEALFKHNKVDLKQILHIPEIQRFY